MKDNFPEEYEFTEDMELSDEEMADIPLTDEPIEEDLAEFTLPEELLDEEVLPEADAAEEVLPEEELFHEDLEVPETAEEVAAAEQDMYDAGLTHPEDAVFYFDDNDTVDEDTEDTELLIESEEIIPEAEAPKQERPVRKGRPKAKKGVGMLGLPHLFATLIWLLIILAIGTTLGRMLWVCAADVLAFGREEKDVTISITTDDTMESIAQKLKSAGLIRYPELFLLYADLTDVEEEGKITTGTFTLHCLRLSRTGSPYVPPFRQSRRCGGCADPRRLQLPPDLCPAGRKGRVQSLGS